MPQNKIYKSIEKDLLRVYYTIGADIDKKIQVVTKNAETHTRLLSFLRQ
jgi:hypothetical protein